MYIYIYVDRRIGMKAEEAGAVLLTLNLLKHNDQHARRTAACLWVIQVFCSSGTQYSCFCHQLGVKFISWRLTLKIIIAAISLNSNPNITLILNPTLHIVIQSTLLLNSSLTRKASTLNVKGRLFQKLYLLLCLNLYVDNLSNRIKSQLCSLDSFYSKPHRRKPWTGCHLPPYSSIHNQASACY